MSSGGIWGSKGYVFVFTIRYAPSQELKMLPYIMQEFCGNLNRDKSWENWVILWHMTTDKLNIQALCDVSAQCHIYVVNK